MLYITLNIYHVYYYHFSNILFCITWTMKVQNKNHDEIWKWMFHLEIISNWMWQKPQRMIPGSQRQCGVVLWACWFDVCAHYVHVLYVCRPEVVIHNLANPGLSGVQKAPVSLCINWFLVNWLIAKHLISWKLSLTVVSSLKLQP